MRDALIFLAMAALAAPAAAGQNPNIRIFLDADPPNRVHEICPALNTAFDVYVCFDCFGPGGGLRGSAIAFVRSFGGIKLSQANLLDGLDFGDPELQPHGWVFTGSDCTYPDGNGIVVAARVTYLYTGPPGNLDITPTDAQPGAALDCDFQEDDLYCIQAHLGICVPPNLGSDCECLVSPAERASWGSIKALYQ